MEATGTRQRKSNRGKRKTNPPDRPAWEPFCRCAICDGRQRWPGYYTGLIPPPGEHAKLTFHRIRISYDCYIENQPIYADEAELARQSDRWRRWCSLVDVIIDYRDGAISKDEAFERLRALGVEATQAAWSLRTKFDTIERPAAQMIIAGHAPRPSMIAAEAGLRSRIETKFGTRPRPRTDHPVMGGACELCGGLKVRKNRFCMEHAGLAMDIERKTGRHVLETLDPNKPETWLGVRDELAKKR